MSVLAFRRHYDNAVKASLRCTHGDPVGMGPVSMWFAAMAVARRAQTRLDGEEPIQTVQKLGPGRILRLVGSALVLCVRVSQGFAPPWAPMACQAASRGRFRLISTRTTERYLGDTDGI